MNGTRRQEMETWLKLIAFVLDTGTRNTILGCLFSLDVFNLLSEMILGEPDEL